MKKRSILAPVPSTAPEPTQEETKVEPESKSINDADVFELPPMKEEKAPVEPQKEPAVVIEESVAPPTPAPKKKRSAAQYAHLAAAREKSLASRKKKKEERMAWEEEYGNSKERFMYQKLHDKYGNTSAPSGSAVPPPAPTPIEKPPPSVQPSSISQPESRPISMEATSGIPSQNDPYRAKGSSQFNVDYDRIINGVRDTFLRDQEFMSQYEEDIRRDEKHKADNTYKEQMKKWEQDQHRRQQAQSNAYGSLSGRARTNNVFERTKGLQQRYTEKYRNGWYNY